MEGVNNLVDESWRATGQSLLYASYFGIGAIAGNFWTGLLYDMALSISDIFLLNAFIVTGVGLWTWIFLKGKTLSPSHTMRPAGYKCDFVFYVHHFLLSIF